MRVDELTASGHLDRLEADLADVAGLGVDVWRYGMPWRLTEPEPGTYDWTLWDRALDACERAGLAAGRRPLPLRAPRPLRRLLRPGVGRRLRPLRRRLPRPLPRADLVHARQRARHHRPVLVPARHVERPAGERRGLLHRARPTSRSPTSRRWRGSGPTATAGGSARRASAASSPTPTTRPASRRRPRPATSSGRSGTCSSASSRVASAARLVDVVDDAVLGAHRPSRRLRADGPDRGRPRHLPGQRRPPTVDGRRARSPSTIASRPTRRRPPHGTTATASTSGWPRRPTSVFRWPTARRGSAALVGGLDRLRADGRPARGVCWYSRGDQYDWDTALIEPVGKVTEVGLFDADRRPARPRSRPRPSSRRRRC